MASLRTPEGKIKYKEYIQNLIPNDKCSLCEKESLENFDHWKIISNSFPYDQIAETHHMIVPIRHVTEQELNKVELQEIIKIKNSFINTTYDYIIEATPKNKSIPGHFHLHLIVGKS